MQEFPYSRFMKIVAWIACPLLIVTFIIIPFQFRDANTVVYFTVVIPASVAMLELGVLGLMDAMKGKLVIEEQSLTYHSVFGRHMLPFDQIKGFRQDDNYLWIVPIDAKHRRIKLSKYLKDFGLIVDWLAMRYRDLDVEEGEAAERAILDNDEYGITEESRREKLDQARRAAKVVNIGAWLLLAGLLFLRQYAVAVILLCCLYPFVVITTSFIYRGLISADDSDKSKIPNTTAALILPGMGLALYAIHYFDVIEHPPMLWISVVFISLTVSILYLSLSFRPQSGRLKVYGNALLITFLCLFYGYGVTVSANCILDKSQPATFTTTVAGKHSSNGKTRTYYLELNAWGTLREAQDVSVSYGHYQSAAIGDTITLTQHDGFLNIAWIEIEW